MNTTRRLRFVRWTSILLLVGTGGTLLFRSGLQRTFHREVVRPALETAPQRLDSPSPDNPASQTSRNWSSWASGVAAFGAPEFLALVKEAMGITDAERRRTLLADIITAWLEHDARSFNKYFMALEVDGDTGKIGSIVPPLKDALARMADAIVSSQSLQEIVRRLVVHLARADPRDALAWASAWLRGDTHDAALVEILRPLAEVDLTLALQQIGNVNAPLRQMQASAAVSGAWAKSEPSRAASWAAEISTPTVRAMALNSVYLTIAQADPADAATGLSRAEIAMLTEYREKYDADLAAIGLSEANLAANRELYLELLNDGAIPPPNSPDVELMGEAARVVAGRMAEADPTLAISWAESLESDFLKLTAVKSALASWSRRDPEAAINHYLGHYSQYGEMLTSLFATWATADPDVAASGTRLLNDPALRSVATESVVQVWASVDAGQAAGWIDQLPEAERTDRARLAVVTSLATSDPAEAWIRALEIADPVAQYRGLKSAFATLVTEDPAAARTLLDNARISASDVERLSELLRAVE